MSGSLKSLKDSLLARYRRRSGRSEGQELVVCGLFDVNHDQSQTRPESPLSMREGVLARNGSDIATCRTG